MFASACLPHLLFVCFQSSQQRLIKGSARQRADRTLKSCTHPPASDCLPASTCSQVVLLSTLRLKRSAAQQSSTGESHTPASDFLLASTRPSWCCRQHYNSDAQLHTAGSNAAWAKTTRLPPTSCWPARSRSTKSRPFLTIGRSVHLPASDFLLASTRSQVAPSLCSFSISRRAQSTCGLAAETLDEQAHVVLFAGSCPPMCRCATCWCLHLWIKAPYRSAWQLRLTTSQHTPRPMHSTAHHRSVLTNVTPHLLPQLVDAAA